MQEFLPLAVVGLVKDEEIYNPAVQNLANTYIPSATLAAIITALYSAFESKVDDAQQEEFQSTFVDMFSKIFTVRELCIDTVDGTNIFKIKDDDE